MLVVDTRGDFASIQAGGSIDELVKEIIMIVGSVANGISKQSLPSAILLIATVAGILNDDDFVSAVLLDKDFEKGIVTVAKEEDETAEQAELRARIEAIAKFSKYHPIKVDENYNVIDDEEEED